MNRPVKSYPRQNCAVLPLVLKGKWYEMIESGEKLEEYRLDTPYWRTRINKWLFRSKAWREPRVVEFRLGYAKDAPRMAFIVDRVVRYLGNMTAWHIEWGEPCDKGPYYALKLGERIKLSSIVVEFGEGVCLSDWRKEEVKQ